MKRRTGFALLDKGVRRMMMASPFDYKRQVLVAVPDDMPEPTGVVSVWR
jgi:Rad3-related DNA helicase